MNAVKEEKSGRERMQGRVKGGKSDTNRYGNDNDENMEQDEDEEIVEEVIYDEEEEVIEEEEEEEERGPVEKHVPNDRFMVTVSKTSDDTGINLVDYKGKIYVSDVERKGPFYSTAVTKGDEILAINGKKSKDIKSIAYAEELMEFKDKITLFVMRPDPVKDKGYQWVMENC